MLAFTAAALVLAPLDVRAATVDNQSPVGGLAKACRSSNAAGRYAESFAYCIGAAEAYRREQNRGASVFDSYYNAAEMLSFAASDQIGVGQNAPALGTVYAAHRLLQYVNSLVTLTPDQRRDVHRTAGDLQRLERLAQNRLALATPSATKGPARGGPNTGTRQMPPRRSAPAPTHGPSSMPIPARTA